MNRGQNQKGLLIGAKNIAKLAFKAQIRNVQDCAKLNGMDLEKWLNEFNYTLI